MADFPARPTWVARPTPLHHSQDLPVALLHLRDRYSRADPHSIQPFHLGNQDAGRPQAQAVALTTGMAWDIVDGMAWDIVDLISMPATQD